MKWCTDPSSLRECRDALSTFTAALKKVKQESSSSSNPVYEYGAGRSLVDVTDDEPSTTAGEYLIGFEEAEKQSQAYINDGLEKVKSGTLHRLNRALEVKEHRQEVERRNEERVERNRRRAERRRLQREEAAAAKGGAGKKEKKGKVAEEAAPIPSISISDTTNTTTIIDAATDISSSTPLSATTSLLPLSSSTTTSCCEVIYEQGDSDGDVDEEDVWIERIPIPIRIVMEEEEVEEEEEDASETAAPSPLFLNTSDDDENNTPSSTAAAALSNEQVVEEKDEEHSLLHGIQLLSAKRYKEAISIFSRVIDKSINTPKTIIVTDREEQQEEEERYNTNSVHPLFYVKRAAAYHSLQEHSAALADGRSAEKAAHPPCDWSGLLFEVHWLRSKIFMAQEQLAEALAALEAAEQLDLPEEQRRLVAVKMRSVIEKMVQRNGNININTSSGSASVLSSESQCVDGPPRQPSPSQSISADDGKILLSKPSFLGGGGGDDDGDHTKNGIVTIKSEHPADDQDGVPSLLPSLFLGGPGSDKKKKVLIEELSSSSSFVKEESDTPSSPAAVPLRSLAINVEQEQDDVKSAADQAAILSQSKRFLALGDLFFKERKFAEALEQYSFAVQFDSNSAEARLKRAQVMRAQEDLFGVETFATEVLEIDNLHRFARQLRAEAYLKQNKNFEAFQEFVFLYEQFEQNEEAGEVVQMLLKRAVESDDVNTYEQLMLASTFEEMMKRNELSAVDGSSSAAAASGSSDSDEGIDDEIFKQLDSFDFLSFGPSL